MKALFHIDRIHLNAAEGWLGLRDLASAGDELNEITPAFRRHPEVMLMRCQLHQAAKQWKPMLVFAQTLVEEVPDVAEGWIYRSAALHELKLTQEAFDLLLPAAKNFPKQPVIEYNLGCYACRLGKLGTAMKHLDRAFDLGHNRGDLRLNAQVDPNLKPLWLQICER